MKKENVYSERYRPQFHFTARSNWLNDPNGCVFFQDEYHLFFQHNPSGLEWGNMSWGHAVSQDLLHWQQWPHAILPYKGGTIFSGSAIVDTHNDSGLGTPNSTPLIAVFTHAQKPFGQALAWSDNRGHSWKLYNNGRHVIPNQGLNEEERDPYIFWHNDSSRWIMLLWVGMNQVRFFSSRNLLHWIPISDFTGEGFYECPELLRLAVDNDKNNMKWVLYDASLWYWIGTFDGERFTPESGPVQGEFGDNFYAGRTWNNLAIRTVQIGWMRNGRYPGMPFNQQMSFPCTLSLISTPGGTRLCRNPITEIQDLRMSTNCVTEYKLRINEELTAGNRGDLFDIEIEAELKDRSCLAIRFYHYEITCTTTQIECLGKTAPVLTSQGRLNLRILLDRTSIELFAGQGDVVISSCFIPSEPTTFIRLFGQSGNTLIRKLKIHHLASIW